MTFHPYNKSQNSLLSVMKLPQVKSSYYYARLQELPLSQDILSPPEEIVPLA